VAAVIKVLSGLISAGPYAVFTNWSPYVLLIAGAGAFFLLSNAFQAGPLAASQPGLTIVDPLVASILGVFLFRDRIRHDPIELLGEGIALAVLVMGVVMLSRSPLVQGPSAERVGHTETEPNTPVLQPVAVENAQRSTAVSANRPSSARRTAHRQIPGRQKVRTASSVRWPFGEEAAAEQMDSPRDT
jgi:hypothetical protein